ncbi:MAG: peptidoglycan DD-metalloendopeptidase family protein [Caulobacterales bacterium]|nr:peptidoglycan DD-metalloendopeptidase family protein [Caulobacterales bacterium]
MFELDLEPVVFCLFASIAWAPVVYLAAIGLDRGREPSASEMIWLAALGVAALPTMLAPALGAAGISLRRAAAAAPQEFIAAPIDYQQAEAFYAASPAPALAPALTPEVFINALGLLYIYGVILAGGVWLVRSLVFSAHVRNSTPVKHPELVYALNDWAARLGLDHRCAPRLRKSDAISSVCVYGVFRPIILIPTTLDARVSFKDLVLMGAHELAHVKRGDGVFFAACSFARVLFWFNPFVKRLAARAELAAEQNADRLVLEAGADRRAYAACFVEGLRFAAERARETRVAVPSFTPFDRKSRRDRLDAILSGKDERTQPSKLLLATGFFIAAALAFAQAAFAVAPAQAETTPDEAETTTTFVVATADEAASVSEPLVTANDGYELPVEGEVTLAFEQSADVFGDGRKVHQGVDIRAAKGTPVKSPADGVVVDATDIYQGNPAWGKVVVIRHRDGLISRFAHLDSYTVKRGDRVKKGEVIAAVGATGKVTGPHLHFETLRDGERVDPMLTFAKPAPAPVPAVAPAPTPLAPLSPEPADVAEPAVAPVPAVPATPAEPATPALAPEWPEASLIGEGKAVFRIRSKDGSGKEDVVILAGGDNNSSFARTLTPEERKRFEADLKKMKRDLKDAQKKHADAMKKLGKEMSSSQSFAWATSDDGFKFSGINFDGLDFDGSEFENFLSPDRVEEIQEEAARAAEEAAARWEEAQNRQQELADRERERAERQAEREAERAELLREAAERRAEEQQLRAEEQQRRAEEQQQRLEEQRQREEERRQREAELRQDRIEREIEVRQARNEREEALRQQAEAIADAQRDLEEERARIEKMLADLQREKASKNTDK